MTPKRPGRTRDARKGPRDTQKRPRRESGVEDRRGHRRPGKRTRSAGGPSRPSPTAATPLRSPWSTAKLAVGLAVAAFLVYNANGREAYPTGDSRPTALLPLSILYQGNLDLNEYHPPGAAVQGPIRSESGRILSNYSPLPALLSLPIYLPAWPHRAEIDGDILRWAPFFSKLAGSLFASLAVACFFLAAAQVASHRAALLSALVLAFGSPFWMSASQTLGQHALTVLFGSIALFALARLERTGSARWTVEASLACALAVGIRLSNAVLFAAVLAYLLIAPPPWRGGGLPAGEPPVSLGSRLRAWMARRRHAAVFVAPALLVAAPFVMLLLSMLGGAGGGLQAFAFLDRIRSQLTSPLGAGLPGLLVSPGEGLFFWSPVLILLLLPVAGVLAAPADERRRLLLLSLALFVLLVLFYSKYVEWWGGRTYGPRYVTDALPFLMLPVAAGLDAWLDRRWFWIAFVVLLAWSAYVQVLGAFRYPCRGEEPSRIRRDEYRVWDAGDNDIVLCSESLRRSAPDFESARRLVRMSLRELVD